MLLIIPLGVKFISLFIILHVIVSNQALAGDPFTNIRLSPSFKSYLVLRDVNVRAKPKNKSPRVGRLKRNDRVSAIGKARGTQWIAVKKEQKELGFVYGKALVPVIDGSLMKPISDNIITNIKNGKILWPCDYQIRFLGKAKIELSLQVTSDYNLELECDYNNKPIRVNATMFLTELPYLDDKQPIFQINVDLFNIPLGAGDMFSTTLLYHAMKNKIVFDSVNKEPLSSRRNIAEREVTNIKAVLTNAVEMAYKSWGPIVWSELAKTQ